MPTNNALFISISAWAVAQVMKVIVLLVKKKQFDLRYLVGSGGMPSSHAAFVSALAVAVAVIEGLDSVAFAIAAVFALVIIYDAGGVRRSVGQQAAVLNRVLRELRLRRPAIELGRDLRELIGHTRLQVIVGVIIGMAVAGIMLALNVW